MKVKAKDIVSVYKDFYPDWVISNYPKENKLALKLMDMVIEFVRAVDPSLAELRMWNAKLKDLLSSITLSNKDDVFSEENIIDPITPDIQLELLDMFISLSFPLRGDELYGKIGIGRMVWHFNDFAEKVKHEIGYDRKTKKMRKLMEKYNES